MTNTDLLALPDVVTMTDDQCLVLDRMSDELGYPFRDVAHDVQISERECRRIVHGFHATGMTGFGALYSDEDSRIMGRGYWLREPGWEAQEQVRRALGSRLYAMRDARWADYDKARSRTTQGTSEGDAGNTRTSSPGDMR